jgi:hypothetical protein
MEAPTPSSLFPRDLKTLSLLDDKKVKALAEDYGLYVGSDAPFSRTDCLNKIMSHFGVCVVWSLVLAFFLKNMSTVEATISVPAHDRERRKRTRRETSAVTFDHEAE